MITYQRLIFKTFNSIISIKPKSLQSIGKYNFSSDNGKDDKYEFPFNFNRE
jgi:hypothetical protein